MINKAISTLADKGDILDVLEHGGFIRYYTVEDSGDSFMVSVDITSHQTRVTCKTVFFREQYITPKGKAEAENKTVKTIEDVYKDVAEAQREVELEYMRKAVRECGKDEQREGKTWRARISEKIQRKRI